MNENATDESTPTGKALGNVALVALSAAAIVGGGVLGTKAVGKLANGAKGLAKGAQNKVATKVANRKTAKDIKKEAKNIANNHGSELTSGEVRNLAEQNQMMSNYTTQANPNLNAEQIKDLNIARGEQNIENHKNLRDLRPGDAQKNKEDIDVTSNLDDLFDSGYDYGDGNVVPPTPYGDGPTGRTSLDMAHNSDLADLKTVQQGFDGLDAPTITNDYNINGDDVRKNLETVPIDDIRNAKKSPEEQERIRQMAEDEARMQELQAHNTELSEQTAARRKSIPGAALEDNNVLVDFQAGNGGKIDGYTHAGDQAGFFGSDGNIDSEYMDSIKPGSKAKRQQQAKENVAARNSTFSSDTPASDGIFSNLHNTDGEMHQTDQSSFFGAFDGPKLDIKPPVAENTNTIKPTKSLEGINRIDDVDDSAALASQIGYNKKSGISLNPSNSASETKWATDQKSLERIKDRNKAKNSAFGDKNLQANDKGLYHGGSRDELLNDIAKQKAQEQKWENNTQIYEQERKVKNKEKKKKKNSKNSYDRKRRSDYQNEIYDI